MLSRALSTLFPDHPYFDGKLFGIQGGTSIAHTAVRHFVMSSFVKHLNQDSVKILEIGSWVGNSALTWSEAIYTFCPKGGALLCVDPWKPYFTEQETQLVGSYSSMQEAADTGLAYELFLHNIKFAAPNVKISHIRNTLPDCSDLLRQDGYDLIYIDGSHHYEDVLMDITHANRLLRPGGIICGDDLELQYDDCDQALARSHAATDWIHDPLAACGYHPGVTLAIYDYFKSRVWSKFGTWAALKVDANTFAIPEWDEGEGIIPSHFPEAARIESAQIISPPDPATPFRNFY